MFLCSGVCLYIRVCLLIILCNHVLELQRELFCFNFDPFSMKNTTNNNKNRKLHHQRLLHPDLLPTRPPLPSTAKEESKEEEPRRVERKSNRQSNRRKSHEEKATEETKQEFDDPYASTDEETETPSEPQETASALFLSTWYCYFLLHPSVFVIGTFTLHHTFTLFDPV